MDFAAGRSVCLGLAKRGHCGANRAPRDEPVGIGLDGLVRDVFAGRGIQLLEVAVKPRRPLLQRGSLVSMEQMRGEAMWT
jgi:hypothetical protein